MKILIAGPPKSGTTALFYKIRNSLPKGPVREIFEPTKYEEIEADAGQAVIAKILVGTPYPVDYGSFEAFDKKIGLVRDPRDGVISSLLYGIFDSPLCEDRVATGQILGLLRRKEENPDSVSVLDIIRLMQQVWIPAGGKPMEQAEALLLSLPLMRGTEREYYQWRVDVVGDVFRQRPDYFILKYEDLVAEKLEGLEQHLGWSLQARENIALEHQRVIRTKGVGDWRNWFLEEDVAFFQPMFAPFMNEFGYPADWTPASAPVILPEHASGYVRSLIAERRAVPLLRDQEKAQELLVKVRKTFKTFYSRYLPQVQTAGEQLEQEMDDLQVGVNYLVHSLRAARGKIQKTETELASARAELKELRAKMQQLREEHQGHGRGLLKPIAKLFGARGSASDATRR